MPDDWGKARIQVLSSLDQFHAKCRGIGQFGIILDRADPETSGMVISNSSNLPSIYSMHVTQYNEWEVLSSLDRTDLETSRIAIRSPGKKLEHLNTELILSDPTSGKCPLHALD